MGLTEGFRGRHLRFYEIPGEFVQAPLGSPNGGAVEQSETERGSRHPQFYEILGEYAQFLGSPVGELADLTALRNRQG